MRYRIILFSLNQKIVSLLYKIKAVIDLIITRIILLIKQNCIVAPFWQIFSQIQEKLK
jgi:hypothetical protein